MTQHKHCKQCGLDFEPEQAWSEYCGKKCIEDYQKAHPTYVAYPTTMMPTTNIQFTGTWKCGSCGVDIPIGQSHACIVWSPTTGPVYR